MKVRQVTFDEIMDNPFEFIGKQLFGETKDKSRLFSIKIRSIETYVSSDGVGHKYIDTGYHEMQYYKDMCDCYNWYIKE